MRRDRRLGARPRRRQDDVHGRQRAGLLHPPRRDPLPHLRLRRHATSTTSTRFLRRQPFDPRASVFVIMPHGDARDSAARAGACGPMRPADAPRAARRHRVPHRDPARRGTSRAEPTARPHGPGSSSARRPEHRFAARGCSPRGGADRRWRCRAGGAAPPARPRGHAAARAPRAGAAGWSGPTSASAASRCRAGSSCSPGGRRSPLALGLRVIHLVELPAGFYLRRGRQRLQRVLAPAHRARRDRRRSCRSTCGRSASATRTRSSSTPPCCRWRCSGRPSWRCA